MKSVGGIGKITPIQLLNEGKVWLDIWNKTSIEINSLLPATYCLFTALELYMKAYLVFKNSEYAETEKLKNKCGHKFKTILDEITTASKNTDLLNEINIQIEKYGLKNIALDKLKYPENGRAWILDHGLEKKEHTLHNIFKDINLEITKGSEQWIIETYPKKTKLSGMTFLGYNGKIEEINLEDLSNICSNCLPDKITIFEEYDYPWNKELIPNRTCKLCNRIFDPKGMRPPFSF